MKRAGLVVLLGLVFAACDSAPPARPLVCEYGVEWIKESYRDNRLGRCFHEGWSEIFLWSKGAATFEAVKACPATTPARRWETMEKLDALIGRIEVMFERWINEFDQRPWRTGVKLLLAFLLVRFAYRLLIKR